MLYPPLILLIVTLVSMLAVFRQSRPSFGFNLLMGWTAIWASLAIFTQQMVSPGPTLNIIFFCGYTATWVAIFAMQKEFKDLIWNIPLVLALLLFMVISPELTLDLLSWGAVVAVPLTTRQVLLLADRTQEIDIFDGETRTENRPFTVSGKVNKGDLAQDRPILEALPIGILLSTADGEIDYVNQKASDLLGVARIDLEGQSIMTVLSRLPMIPRTAGESRQENPSRFELNGRQIEGEMVIVNHPDGKMQRTVAFLSDISDIFYAEKAKTRFLNHLSNELRTPLTAIKGYVQMLENQQEEFLTPDQNAYLTTIQRNISRMVEQVNSLIHVASVKEQPQISQPSAADLNLIVPEVIKRLEPLAARSQLSLKFHLDPKLQPIHADSQHVATIIEELVTNGIRFTESGGWIGINVSFQEGDSAGTSFAVVEVEDSGVGIDPHKQKTIFDDFTHRDNHLFEVPGRRGIGVGLSIVRALVEAYGGRIWLESALGSGSKFTFILPVEPATSQQLALPVD